VGFYVFTIRRLRESPHQFGRGRALQSAPGLHPSPLFVTITDGKLMSRVGCGRPALAQSPARICLRVDFCAIRELGLKGASSHSGRRTYITRLAKRVVEAGGSLRDVQQLAGHSSLSTTQRYIEGSSEAKRRVTELVWGDSKKACAREKHL
jgi:integrase